MMDKKRNKSVFAFVVSVVFYLAACVGYTLLNKYILVYFVYEEDQDTPGFRFPIFLTLCRLTISFFLLYMMGEIRVRNRSFPLFVPRCTINTVTIRRIFPYSCIFLSMVTMNMICLYHVSVWYFQVLRSLLVLLQVILTFFMFGGGVLKSCTVMVILGGGFYLGTQGEVSLDATGYYFGIGACFCMALNNMLRGKSFQIVNNDHWQLEMYNSCLAAIVLAPFLFVSGEFQGILNTEGDPFAIFGLALLSGFLGFVQNLSVYYMIKNTSSFTSSFIVELKSTVQSLSSVYLFNTAHTQEGYVGVALCVFGTLLYAWFRYNDMKESSRRKVLASDSVATSAGGDIESGKEN